MKDKRTITSNSYYSISTGNITFLETNIGKTNLSVRLQPVLSKKILNSWPTCFIIWRRCVQHI